MMLEVHQSLMLYICKKLVEPEWSHIRFELSDSTVQGEGELKILSRLLHERPETETQRKETHLIVGGDSDLLVMAMASGRENVFVVDEVDGRNRPSSSSKRRGGSSEAKCFSRTTAEELWKVAYLEPGTPTSVVANLALDLALLAILCNGNDYLPGISGLRLTNKQRPGLWTLYLNMRHKEGWKDQNLVIRTCACTDDQRIAGEGGSERGPWCKSSTAMDVSLNRPMLLALLNRYHKQRYMAAPNGGSQSEQDDDDSSVWTVANSWDAGSRKNGSNGNGGTEKGRPYVSSGIFAGLEPDVNAYLDVVQWVLHMYSTGSVSDWRASYDLPAPMLHNMLKTLEGAVEPGSCSSMKKKARSETAKGPLLPAACALALLPKKGKKLAAFPLRHLMDPDSPFAEIYAVCDECKAIAEKLRSVGREFDVVKTELAELQASLSAAGMDAKEAYAAEGGMMAALDKAEKAHARLKSLLSELGKSQVEHLATAHPHKPFPTDLLEESVAAVPLNKYPWIQRHLARFGREYVFSLLNEEEKKAQTLPKHHPPWVNECLALATLHPKVADPTVVKTELYPRIQRQLIPMYPYMRGNTATMMTKKGRQQGPPTMAVMCQLRQASHWSSPAPAPCATAQMMKYAARCIPRMRRVILL